ncbi:MAG TPA: hypothetical protein VGO00_14785 [Kofleriaceae bacterium]|nr:hypothetical protein [Kofleriaceae bacterium]
MDDLIPSNLVLWACIAGSLALLVGLVLYRAEISRASGPDRILVLGYVFVAAPLAVFGTEHMLATRLLVGLVPSWMPAPMFWTYFVGVALFAAAASLVARKLVGWSALLLAVMFFTFVLSMDVPGVIDSASERLPWTLMLRETAFAGGALALAGSARTGNARLSGVLIAIGRTCVAVPLIVYAVEHFAFPAFAPGVPLKKLTPAWVPVRELWAVVVGAILLVAGVAMLINRRTRLAAAVVGAVMTFLTLVLYFPLLVQAWGTPQALEGLNYVADTLLFGGTVLLVGIAAGGETRR